MSFGFRVTNDYGNVSVDENNPVFTIMSADQVANFIGGATLDDDQLTVSFAIVFQQAVTSDAPPLVFARAKNTGIAVDIKTIIPVGSPGQWQGIRMSVTIFHGATSPDRVDSRMNAHLPDLAIVVAGSLIKGNQTTGMRIRDSLGRIVFDAGNNHALYSRDLTWVYVDRDDKHADGTHNETWKSSDNLTPSEFVLISPVSIARAVRVSGEVAYWSMGFQGSNSTIVTRLVNTPGGLGTFPFFWPLTTIKPSIGNIGTPLTFSYAQ